MKTIEKDKVLKKYKVFSKDGFSVAFFKSPLVKKSEDDIEKSQKKLGLVYVGLPTEISTGGWLHINIPKLELEDTRKNFSDKYKEYNIDLFEKILVEKEFSQLFNDFVANMRDKSLAWRYIPEELYEYFYKNSVKYYEDTNLSALRFLFMRTDKDEKLLCVDDLCEIENLTIWEKDESVNQYINEDWLCDDSNYLLLDNAPFNIDIFKSLLYEKEHSDSEFIFSKKDETWKNIIKKYYNDKNLSNNAGYYYIEDGDADANACIVFFKGQSLENINTLVEQFCKEVIKDDCSKIIKEDVELRATILNEFVKITAAKTKEDVDLEKLDYKYLILKDKYYRLNLEENNNKQKEYETLLKEIFGKNSLVNWNNKIDDEDDLVNLLIADGKTVFDIIKNDKKSHSKYVKYVKLLTDFYSDCEITIWSDIELFCQEEVLDIIYNYEAKTSHNRDEEIAKRVAFSIEDIQQEESNLIKCDQRYEADIKRLDAFLDDSNIRKIEHEEEMSVNLSNDLDRIRTEVIDALREKIYVVPYNRDNSSLVYMYGKKMLPVSLVNEGETYSIYVLFENKNGSIENGLKALMNNRYKIYYENCYTPLDIYGNLYPEMNKLCLGSQLDYERIYSEIFPEQEEIRYEDDEIKQLLLYQYIDDNGKMFRGYGKVCPITKMKSYVEDVNKKGMSALSKSNALHLFYLPIGERRIPFWGSYFAEQLLTDYNHDMKVYLVDKEGGKEYLLDKWNEQMRELIQNVGYDLRIKIIMNQFFSDWSKVGAMRKLKHNYKCKEEVFDVELTAVHRAIMVKKIADQSI